jgi:hypothetical protein
MVVGEHGIQTFKVANVVLLLLLLLLLLLIFLLIFLSPQVHVLTIFGQAVGPNLLECQILKLSAFGGIHGWGTTFGCLANG